MLFHGCRVWPFMAVLALALAVARRSAFRWALIKTGPLPKGVTFRCMVSDDSVQWTPASPRHVNTTWSKQVQDVMGDGKYLQVRFFSAHKGLASPFRVREFELYGGAD
ncbi:hypothetical protein D3C72_669850 [compost metagenome]